MLTVSISMETRAGMAVAHLPSVRKPLGFHSWEEALVALSFSTR